MLLSLNEFLEKKIKQMILGIGKNGKGNIFPLITQEVEQTIIKLVLKETKFNYLQAAKILGISRSTLYRKIENYRITDPTKNVSNNKIEETDRDNSQQD